MAESSYNVCQNLVDDMKAAIQRINIRSALIIQIVNITICQLL